VVIDIEARQKMRGAMGTEMLEASEVDEVENA
jgi:hypothetical protein